MAVARMETCEDVGEFEHWRVALTKHLDDPFVRYASGTEPCCAGGAQVIEPGKQLCSSRVEYWHR
jgi:hypothetical protein